MEYLTLFSFTLVSVLDDHDPCVPGGVHHGNHPALPRHYQPLHRDSQDPRESQPEVNNRNYLKPEVNYRNHLKLEIINQIIDFFKWVELRQFKINLDFRFLRYYPVLKTPQCSFV